jgi:hypothetical protein
MKWHSLPSPASFLEDVIQNLCDGTSVVIAASTHAPIDLSDAVANALRDRHWDVQLEAASTVDDPLRWLTELLYVEPDRWVGWSVEKLFARIRNGLAIVIEGVNERNWELWRTFLRDFELASRARAADLRPVLLVVIRGVQRKKVQIAGGALVLKYWAGVIGELDTMIYVDQRLRSMRDAPKHHKLLVRQITALALWDLALADYLLEQSEQDLFDHKAVLERARSSLLKPELPLGAEWERGGSEQFDGIDLSHAFVLIENGDRQGELNRRMWAAQATELLPLIEIRRRELAKGLERHVRCPFWIDGDRKVDSLYELEIGSLAHVARVNKVAGELRDRAESLARCRNVLAHLGFLDSSDALDRHLHG